MFTIDEQAVMLPGSALAEGHVPEHVRRPGSTHLVSWKFQTRHFDATVVTVSGDRPPENLNLNVSQKQWGSWYDIMPEELGDAYRIGGELLQRHIAQVAQQMDVDPAQIQQASLYVIGSDGPVRR